MTTAEPHRLAIAGSTRFTQEFAALLHNDPRFSVAWVLTPPAKPVGREQTVQPNPLDAWAQTHGLPVVYVDKKIDQTVKKAIETAKSTVDLLLVVDFGYIVPQWLLELPTVAALNIHPSKLPEWRGSSPGQAVLLSGAATSAISLIKMDNALDHGPLLSQLEFPVEHHWTQTEYYNQAFQLMQHKIGDLLEQYLEKGLPETPQPDETPTPIARELNKEDSFVPWELLHELQMLDSPDSELRQATVKQLPPFLVTLWNYVVETTKTPVTWGNLGQFVARAARALQPWPGLWTIVPTTKGERRLKIISATTDPSGALRLERVQLEGQQPALWNQIKNVVTS